MNRPDLQLLADAASRGMDGVSMDAYKPDLDKYPKLREMFAEYGEGELADLLTDARLDALSLKGLERFAMLIATTEKVRLIQSLRDKASRMSPFSLAADAYRVAANEMEKSA